MKSSKSAGSNREISVRDSVGKDIYSQISKYMMNNSVHIIGICIPRRLNDEVRAILRHQARQNGKKLVFIDHSDLVRIVYSVMTERSMELSAV